MIDDVVMMKKYCPKPLKGMLISTEWSFYNSPLGVGGSLKNYFLFSNF